MGDLIGAGIGLLGSVLGGNKAAKADKAGAQQSLTGYNYLTGGAGSGAINQAQTAGVNASQGQAGTQSAIGQLLGTEPLGEGAANGFQNYLNSTGHNFELQQGMGAISGSAAAKGILNSGATAKALTKYGTDLASTHFNNYLSQLGSLGAAQGTTAAQGVNAAGIVGQAGTTGGGNAGQLTASGGANAANGMTTGLGGLGDAVASNWGGIKNFFGKL